jgi:hypothetical protein
MSYESLRVTDLRDIRSRGLKGWSKLRKADLISFIRSNEQPRKKSFEERIMGQRQREKARQVQIETRRDERLKKLTAEANAKAERKARKTERREDANERLRADLWRGRNRIVRRRRRLTDPPRKR